MVVVATGCAINPEDQVPKMTIHIKSGSGVNEGRTFYVVARAVDKQVFLTESYEMVVDKVFANPPSEDVLAAVPVIPGVPRELMIKKPEEAGVAVYCLFSEPGERWKMMLSQPLFSEYDLRLRGNLIVDTTEVKHKKKGLIQRLMSSDEEE